MGPVLVVVADILRDEPLQMALIEGDDVVQQVTPTALHPSFGDSVLPRASERGPHGSDGHRPHCNGNFQAILGVPIKDEKPGSRLIRESLAQLLHDPTAGGMAGDIEVQDAPPAVIDDEKAVEHAEGEGGDSKEVHGRDDFSMIPQKRKPTLGGLRVPRGALHPPGNGSFGNVEAQHQEFTVNAWRAPTGILDDHPENKFSHFFGNSLSAEQSPSFGDGPPVECKS